MKNIQKDSQVCLSFVEIEGDDLVNTAVWKLRLLFTLWQFSWKEGNHNFYLIDFTEFDMLLGITNVFSWTSIRLILIDFEFMEFCIFFSE